MSLLLGILFQISIMLHSETAVFRYHINSEPDSLDPISAMTPTASYVLNSLYAPLLRYQDTRLSNHAATCKAESQTRYKCVLRADWKWSDGIKITAEHLRLGLEDYKKNSPLGVEFFKNIKSVKVLGQDVLVFELLTGDSDFLYRLINPAINPLRPDVLRKEGRVTTGPYFLSSKRPGRSLYLKPNPHYFIKTAKPDVEVFILDSDDTAYRLYTDGKLNFLRRLNTELVPIHKKKGDLFHRSLHRMDMIGFGPELIAFPELRNKLIYGLAPQLAKFQEMFHSSGRPGCLGFEPSIIGKDYCYLAKPASFAKQEDLKTYPRLKLHFAGTRSLDIPRVMQFLQMSWKKNVGLDVELENMEALVLDKMLKSQSSPALFHRGVPLDRPTCLAIIEIFTSKSSNNYLKLQDKTVDDIASKMRSSAGSQHQKLCHKGLDYILNLHRMIPMGSFQFAMLTDGKFSGFKINELNQLDLSELTVKSK